MPGTPRPAALARSRRALRAWFEPRREAYPWRRSRDPYRVLVSELMLQQTQAPRVVPAYAAFLRRFPDVRSLARASRREVLLAWDGLGYNRRAVALSEAARTIVRDHAGRVPADLPTLRDLPGVGPYTAAAVASIAYSVPVAAIDTNVRRIVGRVFDGDDDATPARVRELADSWLDPHDPGSWNEALMDLGREVCRPQPRCEICPLRRSCEFVAAGARPTSPRRRQGPFEGSFRQVRGAVVRALRARDAASLEELTAITGLGAERVAEAVRRLTAEGLLETRRSGVRLSR
ncbi:MAG: A/G-specific adenine glycosylase [Solirubrobacterales bacterium]